MAKYVGLNVDYPITRANGPIFKQTFNTLDARKSNLHVLFRTIPGERVMNPEFGIGIHMYLFENITPELKYELENEIVNQVNTYIPDVVIDSLIIDLGYDGYQSKNTLSISLGFYIKNNPELKASIVENF